MPEPTESAASGESTESAGSGESARPAASGHRWEPVVGERVAFVKSGESGTIVHLTLTEWGLLCDVEVDPPAGTGGSSHRRTDVVMELRPLV